jgi:Family of unknown function (DUF5908)
MPIEIKELYIRVSVNTLPGELTPGAPAAAGAGSAPGDADGDREALVAACVEQVMQLLRDRMER